MIISQRVIKVYERKGLRHQSMSDSKYSRRNWGVSGTSRGTYYYASTCRSFMLTRVTSTILSRTKTNDRT